MKLKPEETLERASLLQVQFQALPLEVRKEIAGDSRIPIKSRFDEIFAYQQFYDFVNNADIQFSAMVRA